MSLTSQVEKWVDEVAALTGPATAICIAVIPPTWRAPSS